MSNCMAHCDSKYVERVTGKDYVGYTISNKRRCRLHCWVLQPHQAALKTGQLVTQRF